MIDDESFAQNVGTQAVERILASSRLDELQQKVAMEAAQAGIHAALATYRKHVVTSLESTGRMMTDTERKALGLLHEAVAVLHEGAG